MKPVSDAAAKALRHRQWHWCRRPNGFSDLPRWRVLADRLGMPVYQVVAFVNRLEEFANRAETRGHVGEFDAAEFGVALGMAEEDAARIFAALEDGERPWIAYGHIADFHDRNPDREDPTVNERKRRSRTRVDVLKKLARLAHAGEIDATARLQVELRLRDMPDGELVALQADLARRLANLSTSSTGGVTRDARLVTRDIVTVTPEQSTQASLPEQNGDGDEAAAADLAARQWLADAAPATVAARMWPEKNPPGPVDLDQASKRIDRWLAAADNDAGALREIIAAADKIDLVGARFHNLVVDQLRRHKQRMRPELPLMAPVKRSISG